MGTDPIRVEVVYALPAKQVLLAIDVPRGTTVIEAIELSGLRQQIKEMVVDPGRLGIFGTRASPETVLRAGDRVEIYRPLIADPKESRRKRAEQEKA